MYEHTHLSACICIYTEYMYVYTYIACVQNIYDMYIYALYVFMCLDTNVDVACTCFQTDGWLRRSAAALQLRRTWP